MILSPKFFRKVQSKFKLSKLLTIWQFLGAAIAHKVYLWVTRSRRSNCHSTLDTWFSTIEIVCLLIFKFPLFLCKNFFAKSAWISKNHSALCFYNLLKNGNQVLDQYFFIILLSLFTLKMKQFCWPSQIRDWCKKKLTRLDLATKTENFFQTFK